MEFSDNLLPFRTRDGSGVLNGLLAKIAERFAIFLLLDINTFLGNTFAETGQDEQIGVKSTRPRFKSYYNLDVKRLKTSSTTV